MKLLVLALLPLLLATPVFSAPPQAADDAMCIGYGFHRGSDGYANCRMQLDMQRQAQYTQHRRAFAGALAAFGQGLSRNAQQPIYQAPRQLNCTSQNFGGIAHTACY